MRRFRSGMRVMAFYAPKGFYILDLDHVCMKSASFGVHWECTMPGNKEHAFTVQEGLMETLTYEI